MSRFASPVLDPLLVHAVQPPLALYGTTQFLTVQPLSHALDRIDSVLQEWARICGPAWRRTGRAILPPLIRGPHPSPASWYSWPASASRSPRSARLPVYPSTSGTQAVPVGIAGDRTGGFPELAGVPLILLLLIAVRYLRSQRLAAGDAAR